MEELKIKIDMFSKRTTTNKNYKTKSLLCVLMPRVFTTASHFKQCAWSFSHWGTDLYPQRWHCTRARSSAVPAFSLEPFRVAGVSRVSALEILGGSSSLVSDLTNNPAAAARGGLVGLTLLVVRGEGRGVPELDADVETSEDLRLSSLSNFIPFSPRPHLVHLANLNIHLPPISQSAAPPGLGNTPTPLANCPSGIWQKLHLPYFQWCTPSGALPQLP